MALILTNKTAATTSWYVYRERSELFSDEIDDDDAVFVGGITGMVGVTIANGPLYWNGSVKAEEFTGVIIGPDLQFSPGPLTLRNDLAMDSWWYVYGLNGRELFNSVLHHGEEREVPSQMNEQCHIDIASVGGDLKLGSVDATPGTKVVLSVTIKPSPPEEVPTR